jgi:acylphosphatase
VNQRRKVIYLGQVQGVGFRQTARQIAQNYPVAGYVRNLSNGNVELVVEGTDEALDKFLGALARRMSGYISGGETEQSPATGEFDSFEIRF